MNCIKSVDQKNLSLSILGFTNYISIQERHQKEVKRHKNNEKNDVTISFSQSAAIPRTQIYRSHGMKGLGLKGQGVKEVYVM